MKQLLKLSLFLCLLPLVALAQSKTEVTVEDNQTITGNKIFTGGVRGNGGTNPEQSISPLDNGAKADVQFAYDCAWTTTTTQVTCANGDLNCVAADASKIMFGVSSTANVTLNALNDAVTVPQGTIVSCASSTIYNISTTTTATCPTATLINCNFAKGTQDDATAINNTEAAAWNTAGHCKALQLPSAAMFIGSAVLNTQIGNMCGYNSTNAGSGYDLNSVGPEVFGEGQANSILVPLPNFNFASCTGGSGAACIAGAPNLQAHDFGINGLGNPVGGTNAVVLFELQGSSVSLCSGGSTGWNLSLAGWGLTSTSTIGFQFGANSCNDPIYQNINVMLFGASSCKAITPQNITAYGLFCYGSKGGSGINPVLTIVNGSIGGQFNSHGGGYLCPLSSGGTVITSNANTFVSTGDIIGVTGEDGSAANCNVNVSLVSTTAGHVYLMNDSLSINSSETSSIINTTAGTTHIRDSRLLATGANNTMIGVGSGATLIDECGNIFLPGSQADVLSGTVVNCATEPSYGGRCLLASAAGPLACVAASTGKVAVPTTLATYTINTKAVQTGSTVIVTPTTDNTGIPGSPTCIAEVFGDGAITASVAATSFTFAQTSTTGIKCYNWSIR